MEKKTFTPTTKRGADTYQKVINAGIHCMASDGFNNTSTNKIAKAAGVTWGTLQHQFGDKARLLEGILEYCVRELIDNLEASLPLETSVEERVDKLVEAVWQNQQSLHSRAMIEILTGVRSDTELNERFHPTLQKLRSLYDQQWETLFGDLALPSETLEAVKQLTFSALRGLNSDLNLRSSDSGINSAKELLKQSLVFLLNSNKSG